MISWVIDNLRPSREHHFIFLCLKEHLDKYPEVVELLKDTCPGCDIVSVNEVTQGAACTILLAKDLINNEVPLMIANSDQYVDCDINKYLEAIDKVDGLIMTFGRMILSGHFAFKMMKLL